MDEAAREAGIRLADEVRALMVDLHRVEVSVDDLEAATEHLQAARHALDGPLRLSLIHI